MNARSFYIINILKKVYESIKVKFEVVNFTRLYSDLSNSVFYYRLFPIISNSF